MPDMFKEQQEKQCGLRKKMDKRQNWTNYEIRSES